jgi:MFS family permease
MVPCWATAVAILPIVAGLLMPPGWLWPCAASLLVGCTLFYCYYGTVYATIQDLYAPAQRGLAMSTYFCGMYLVGALWGPAATGWLSDHFAVRAARLDGVYLDPALPLARALPEAYKAVGLHQALFVVPVLAALLAAILWLAARQLRRDELARNSRGE